MIENEETNNEQKSVFKSLPKTFWVANTMELFERWAWYGMYAIYAIYLTDPIEKGGLGFTDAQRGSITGIVPFILYLLPIFTGAMSDRFGYTRTLISAYAILIAGYFSMGQVTTYFPMFMAFLCVAVGAAMFKPVISATVSHTTNSKTASIGFGLFYAMVNIGGFVGPLIGGILRKLSWDYVFYMSMGAITLNLIMVLLFFKEPDRGNVESKSFATVLKEIGLVFSDLKFVIFLFMLSGFWTAFNQIFITLPLLLRDWVDTSVVWCWFSDFSATAAAACEAKEMFNPEWIVNIDSGSIILLQILISAIVMRFSPISTIIGGILISSLGIALIGVSNAISVIVIAIVIFAIGEMASSPKSTEYIGSIAPRDRKALYMGYSFVPVALGNLIAGILSGAIYGEMGNKVLLATKYLTEKANMSKDMLNQLSLDDLMQKIAEHSGTTGFDTTQLLYDTYNPGNMWFYFAAIGAGAAVLLFYYNLKFKRAEVSE